MKKLRLPVTCFYLVFFSLYSLMTRFTCTAAFIDGNINAVLYRLILLLGCVLALWWFIDSRKLIFSTGGKDDKHIRQPKKNIAFGNYSIPLDILLLAIFVLFLCISTLLNYSYNLMDNLFGLMTFGFELVLFYLMGRTLSDDEWNKILKKVVLCCSVLWDVACAGSLVQFIMDISYTTKYAADHGIVRQGIMDGRLFGLFSDPNFAAFTSLLLLLGLWHILSRTNHLLTRIFIWFSIGLNAIYIILSNSRTIYLSVVGSIMFYVLLRCYKKYQNQKISGIQMLGKLFVRGLATCILLVATYFAILIPLRGIADFICPDRDVAVEMVRDDINSENISNNRFTIWQAYLNLYTEKPLFGFSTRSALPYATKEHPESYLAQTQYVTHNGYLSLLVETGAAGFFVMSVFMILLIVRSGKRIHDRRDINDTYFIFATWMVSILIFCLCFHDIFFTLNLETMLFISGLGFLWQNE